MPFFGQFFGVFHSPLGETSPQEAHFVFNVDRNRTDRGRVLVAQPMSGGTPFGMVVKIASVQPEFVAQAEAIYHRDAIGRPFLTSFPIQDYQPLSFEVRGRFDENSRTFLGMWSASNGVTGRAGFGRVLTSHGLADVQVCGSWSDYKTWAAEIRQSNNPAAAFRGHADRRWKLETSYHRTDRSDLWYYNALSITDLHQHLEAAGIVLQRDNPADFARLVAIAQHHGFPTPLLDWTQSPYIAAYFAFSDALERRQTSDATHVRIYALTEKFASKYSPAIVGLTEIEPGIAFLKVSARDNPRLLAQQGVFTLSTVKDIEHYLTARVVTPNNDFLLAVDIPITEAEKAMSDLSYMGITAATLFPGIDGICRKLKHDMLIGRI
ncbi:FRG domain-containing protein [Paraburkholderia strydomiana]|uniref:FRG domain-containing protein n=1 Tax=Paraburkholderia strydomiana TaxID=1245417 RepID=UPI0038BD231C